MRYGTAYPTAAPYSCRWISIRFSERYGWIQDQFGVSWQLILSNPEGEERPAIVPSLMFAGEQCGRAEEAMQFYLSVFKNSRQGLIARYPQGMEPDQAGTIMFADFMLENQWFAVMDSARAQFRSMRPSLLWFTAILRKRLMTIGKNFLRFRKPSNAVG
jgi:predicted 3-demethylubiquinone-9 3-methyltransferase (glyoxalase superfamily)